MAPAAWVSAPQPWCARFAGEEGESQSYAIPHLAENTPLAAPQTSESVAARATLSPESDAAYATRRSTESDTFYTACD